mgnify:CR=1 FL=1
MINETSCRHCTKRKINCHASCEEYLGWRKKADELRDKCGKARLQDAGFVNAKIKNIYKWQKHLCQWTVLHLRKPLFHLRKN